MQVNPADYSAHFDAYNCRMYKVSPESEPLLSQREKDLLNDYGLPDRAIPFFHFDLHLHLLRDIKIPQCRLLIGTANFPGSDEYIYIHENGIIYLKEEDKPANYVNGSLEQLIDSIYAYSQWLEELEVRGDAIADYAMTEEDIFDIYYKLRSIDRKAVRGHHVWNYLIQFDKHKRESLASSSM